VAETNSDYHVYSMNLMHNVPAKLASAGTALLWLTSALYILSYVLVGIMRIAYPFEIEWMEGAMLDNVHRVLAGTPIYARPSLDFVSFIYPPAYYYAVAAVALVVGPDFVALRLVSYLSAIAVFVLAYLFIERETRDKLAALVGAGLFAATFQIGGAWFDVGRVDSLFLAALVAGLFVLRFHPSLVGHVMAGVLFALAFLTKQSAAVMAAPVLLYACYRNWRQGLVAVGIAVVVAAAAVVAIDRASGGWFTFYSFELPRTYQVFPSRLADFWRVDVVPPIAIAWVIGLAFFTVRRPESPRLFYAAMAAGLLFGAMVSRGNPGGYSNVLIPAFLLGSVLCGMGVATIRGALLEAAPGARARGSAWLAAVCLLQFALLAYNPLAQVPRRGDTEAGRQFVATLASTEGDVWVPYHGHLATMAGKRQFAHWMAVSDILESGIDSLSVPLRASVDSAIGSARFGAIVLSNHPFGNSPDVTAAYDSTGLAIENESEFWPVTGARRRVTVVYRPRAERAAGVSASMEAPADAADGNRLR
jgi:hypothetical protein